MSMTKRAILGWVLVIAMAIGLGLGARVWTWQETGRIRFSLDFQNGYRWGSEVMRDAGLIGPQAEQGDKPGQIETWSRFLAAYVNIYDRVYSEAADRNNDYWLDYPPLRLLIMSVWTKGIRERQPTLEVPASHDVIPMLKFNVCVEFISALSMFFLVRLWVRRLRERTPDRKWFASPDKLAFVAALLVWFNPASLINSHGWPQWDIWILPFFILAALAGSCSRWILCGLMLGAAAFLKGQILIVAAFFPLWALFAEGPHAAFRVLAGWVGMFVGIASPWLLKGLGAFSWPTAFALVGSGVAWMMIRRRPRELPAVIMVGVVLLLVLGYVAPMSSFTWLEIGFHYGSNRYLEMFSGAVYNIPSTLAGLGWNISDPILSFTLSPESRVVLPTIRTLLMVVYFASLVLAAFAMAYHARRRRPEVLLAMAVPWLIMFAWLGQMHERYLLWGAVMSAAAAILNPTLFGLYAVLSVGTVCMILTVMLRHTYQEILPPSVAFLDAMNFGAGVFFSVVLVGAFVYVVWAPAQEILANFAAWRKSLDKPKTQGV